MCVNEKRSANARLLLMRLLHLLLLHVFFLTCILFNQQCIAFDSRSLHPRVAMNAPIFIPEEHLTFDAFRSGFGFLVRPLLAQNVQPILGLCMEIDVPKIGNGPRSLFLARILEDPSRLVLPVFHGTDSRNLPSIFEHGFLVPHATNGVRMRNGSTYGEGVYFANINAPALSLSFSHGSKCLLVCAILGGDGVKAVRDSQVVSDPSFCVPLFVAKMPGGHFNPSTPTASTALADHMMAIEILKHGIDIALFLGNCLREGRPAGQLIHEGHSPESLLHAGYTDAAVYEQRLHPQFGLVTFSRLQSELPGKSCYMIWDRLGKYDPGNANS